MCSKWQVIAFAAALTSACTRETRMADSNPPADYTVYGVAIESLVVRANDLGDLIVLTPTVGDGPEGMAAVEAMRDDADVPEDVRSDFMAKNRIRVPLDAESLAVSIPLRVVARDSLAALQARRYVRARDGTERPRRVHVVHVSRVGFSRDSSQALLYLGHSCGGLCGTGWKVQLRRDPSRRWRIITADVVWIS